MWHREGNDRSGTWRLHKAIEIPAEPAAVDDLPPLLKGFGAVPALVTDINLSLDDRFLYVSCWGTGELKQFDVSDPFNPVETGSVKLGGIAGDASSDSYCFS
jgi:selenium-binding protein 1